LLLYISRLLSKCCQLFGKSTMKWAGKLQIDATLAGHIAFVWYWSLWVVFSTVSWLFQKYDFFPYSVEPKTGFFAVNSLVSWQPLMLENRFLVQAFITFVGIDNDKIWSVTSQNLKWIDNFDKIAVNFF